MPHTKKHKSFNLIPLPPLVSPSQTYTSSTLVQFAIPHRTDVFNTPLPKRMLSEGDNNGHGGHFEFVS
ncbi:hypothetical protein JZ751_010564 [Albula glossodonta]|uniref:Uncharacterized protein n=1 Tax=Albula glossodonta TaxID=121402 RepID=A0A8T2NV84_9TELE|nr:hypothetical protein JZ751_010564 [Albula glossodonta]